MPAKPSIFISYRRQPAADLARYIHHRLSTLRYNVFLDVETINGGRFANIIQQEIINRDVFLVILTPETLQSEWVVREIKTALEKEKAIVPLLAQGFTFATPLPDEIKGLSDYDAVRWDHDFADTAFERLVKAIDPNYRANARPGRPGYVVIAAALLVLVATLVLVAPKVFQPASDPTATSTATISPTTAVIILERPTQQQIDSLNTTATEILLQRTVDAKETSISQSFAESTHLAETAHAPTRTPFTPPQTTATQVIDLGATATEALLQRTVVAQGVINATLLAENTRIVVKSTLTATSSPQPGTTATETVHSTSGLIVGESATVQLIPGYNVLPLRSTPTRTALLRAELDEGTVVTIIEGPVFFERLFWWRVRTADGVEGWAAETLGGNHQVLIPLAESTPASSPSLGQ